MVTESGRTSDALVVFGFVDDLHFDAELWLYDGDAAWHFVTLPPDVADEIEANATSRAGFGSVPVRVTIGATTWSTSLFPDSKAQSYVLPVKKDVRRREGLTAGDPVTVHLSLLEG
jgi:hypothetical protein